jgi:thiol-disulfide isomerase/thioredoxin
MTKFKSSQLLAIIITVYLLTESRYNVFCQNQVYFVTKSLQGLKSVGISYSNELGINGSQLFTDTLKPNIFYHNDKKIITLYSIDDTPKFSKHYLYVEPNDTISINYSNKEVVVSSRYPNEVLFWNKMAEKGYDYNSLLENNNFHPENSAKMQYDTVNSFYQIRKKSVHEIFSKSDSYRKEFIKSIESLNLIIRDFNLLAIIYQDRSAKLIEEIYEDPFLLHEFTEIKQHLIISKKDYSCISKFYHHVLYDYCRFLSHKSLGTNDEFKAVFETICENFNGEIKDIALTIHMREGLKKGLSPAFFKRYKEQCRNYEYVFSIETELIKLDEVNKKIINELLIDFWGNEITWGDFLIKNIGKYVYIDFWASWCGGCKLLVPEFQKLKNEYKKIEFVYISIEATEETWKKSIKSWKIEEYNHFFVKPNSKLIELFAQPSIPRFTLINPKGEIITTEAPHPNNPTVYQYLRDITQY